MPGRRSGQEADALDLEPPETAMTQPDQDHGGRTPSAPDQAEGDDGGRDGSDGRTPSAPDQAEGDDEGGA